MVATVLAVFLLAGGGSALAAALYLLVLALAAFRIRHLPAPHLSSAPQLAVVVPAHDEADLIARCLVSLEHQTYPREAYEIVVVADNCSDATASIARSYGATVMVRDEPDCRGKGRALRWAMDRLLAGWPQMEAAAVVDADSVAEPHLLAGLAACLERGAQVVQAEYLVLDEERTPRSELKSAAFLLFHRVRFAGRAALGLPCSLVGNGMLFSRQVLESVPWNAFTCAEDLEYSINLRLAGVSPVFAAGARVRAPLAHGHATDRAQRLRWEGGRLHLARTRLPQLVSAAVRQRRTSLLDAALDLAVPPLGLLSVAVVAGTALGLLLIALGAVPAWALGPWLAALVAIPGYVLLGLRAAQAPATTYRSLLVAPALVCSQIMTRAHLLGFDASSWVRTERPGEERRREEGRVAAASGTARPSEPPVFGRPTIGGVPIDALRLDEAVNLAMSAIGGGGLTQICTVNLDFLVNARRDPSVRSILCSSQLNLADGAPVVWLARLLGRPIPGRVSGSDFVPRLMEAAAGSGARVFLLGGQDGMAEEAARRLVEMFPGLVVAGCHEPPRSDVEGMANDEIVARIHEAGADILLVAFGHPKQERWIHSQGGRLPVSVAIGVGCTLDLIAGRRSRAPSWMQTTGLEWFYRMAHEPRRLTTRYAVDAWILLAQLVPLTLLQRLRTLTRLRSGVSN